MLTAFQTHLVEAEKSPLTLIFWNFIKLIT